MEGRLGLANGHFRGSQSMRHTEAQCEWPKRHSAEAALDLLGDRFWYLFSTGNRVLNGSGESALPFGRVLRESRVAVSGRSANTVRAFCRLLRFRNCLTPLEVAGCLWRH